MHGDGQRQCPARASYVSILSFADVNKPSFARLDMAWCAKIYDIFNGWADEENGLPAITDKNVSDAGRVKRLHSNMYQRRPTVPESPEPLADSSQPSGQLYNSDDLTEYVAANPHTAENSSCVLSFPGATLADSTRTRTRSSHATEATDKRIPSLTVNHTISPQCMSNRFSRLALL